MSILSLKIDICKLKIKSYVRLLHFLPYHLRYKCFFRYICQRKDKGVPVKG